MADVDDRLRERLERRARLLGISYEALVTRALHREATEPSPTPLQMDADRSTTPSRRELELAAVARTRAIAFAPPETWSKAEQRMMGMRESCWFTDIDLNRAASFARRRDQSLFNAHVQKTGILLPPEPESAEEILKRLQPTEHHIIARYRVHGNAPLARTIELEPFAGASAVRLLAGDNLRHAGGFRELTAIEVSVPVPDVSNRFPRDFSATLDKPPRQPELAVAEMVRAHVLTALRTSGYFLEYSPHESELGAPREILGRRGYADGSFALHSLLAPGAIRARLDPVPWRSVTIDPKTPRLLWEHCRDALAYLGDDPITQLADQFWRAMLTVESRHPRLRDGKAKAPPSAKAALAALQRNDSQLFAEDPNVIAETLYDLRDEVSHLQRNGIRRYGGNIYDPEWRDRLLVHLPVARALAWSTLREICPELPERLARQKPPPLEQMIRDFSEPGFIVSEGHRHNYRSKVAQRLAEEGISVPGAAEFLADCIADGMHNLYVVQASLFSSTTTVSALLALLQPGATFNKTFMAATRDLFAQVPAATAELVEQRIAALHDPDLDSWWRLVQDGEEGFD